jgi:glycerol-3-phosphate dehydrogenase
LVGHGLLIKLYPLTRAPPGRDRVVEGNPGPVKLIEEAYHIKTARPGRIPAHPRDFGTAHRGGGGVSAASEAAGAARATGRMTPAELAAAGPYDLLVVGGGILGAGVARDAAMRGLRVALVERADLAWGTSSRSSRLVHGGLRYLEHGGVRLVMEALRERATLLRIAPHLVRPLAFTFPVHRGERVSLPRLAAGMALYDLLAMFRNVRLHRILGKRAVLEHEPALRERGLVGGARFYDAQCDDARLVVATVRSALHHGARVATYAAVAGLEREGDRLGGRITGARVVDVRPGVCADAAEPARVAATIVVNATGPWTDRLREMEAPGAPPALRLTRGSHVLVPRERLGLEEAVIFTSRVDGRVMFALPWGRFAYLGTTDTDTDESPDRVEPTTDDAIYLLRSANAEFPNAHLTLGDVRAAWAGLRPLLKPTKGSGSPSSVSRDHSIVVGPGGMITVAGGKLTTYRAIAADVVDAAAAELRRATGRRLPSEARTDLEPLPGGETADVQPFRERGEEIGLPDATVEHLLRTYGTETAGIYNLCLLDRALQRPLHPEHPAICAEVVHAVRRELAWTAEDVLLRRLHLFYETADHGLAAIGRVTNLMGRELDWDEGRMIEEAERYREFVLRAPLG